MFSQYSQILGTIAVILGIAGYIPYFINIFKNKTKPHAFTWFIWGLLTGLAFVIQFLNGGGSGSYVTGTAALICLAISAIAIKKGEIIYDKYDWFSLSGGLIGILLWWFTKNPTLAVIMILISDAFGFYPTIRKGIKDPFGETATTFALNSLKYIIAMFAMENYSLATSLYPIYLIFMNGSFVILLILGRKKKSK